MTRGFVIETGNTKKAAAAAWLGSSAYPSFWGLHILEAYHNGGGLEDIIVSGAERIGADKLHELDPFVAPRRRSKMDSESPEYVYVYNTATSELSVYNNGVCALRGNIHTGFEKMKYVFEMYHFLDEGLSIDPATRKVTSKGLTKLCEAFSKYETGEAIMDEVKAGPKTCLSLPFDKPEKLLTGWGNPCGGEDFLYRYPCRIMSADEQDGARIPAWRTLNFELYPEWHISTRNEMRFHVGVAVPWIKLELITPVRGYMRDGYPDTTVSMRAGGKFIRDFIEKNEENLIKVIPAFDIYEKVKKMLTSMQEKKASSQDMAALVDLYTPALRVAMADVPEFIPHLTCKGMENAWIDDIEARRREEREGAQKEQDGGADVS